MLKEFFILAIAVIAMAASKIAPLQNVIQHSSGSTSSGGSSIILGRPPLVPGSGSCRASRNNCNICGCSRGRVQCTNLDCNYLPADVRNGNAVADNNLPRLFSVTLHRLTIGQVYRWGSCGFGVRTGNDDLYCIAQC